MAYTLTDSLTDAETSWVGDLDVSVNEAWGESLLEPTIDYSDDDYADWLDMDA